MSETCSGKTRGNGWHQGRCGVKASVERNGAWYCRRHDPDAVAARKKATKDRWHEEASRRNAIRTAALDRCAGLKCGIPSGEGVWLSLREADDLIARLEGRHT